MQAPSPRRNDNVWAGVEVCSVDSCAGAPRHRQLGLAPPQIPGGSQSVGYCPPITVALGELGGLTAPRTGGPSPGVGVVEGPRGWVKFGTPESAQNPIFQTSVIAGSASRSCRAPVALLRSASPCCFAVARRCRSPLSLGLLAVRPTRSLFKRCVRLHFAVDVTKPASVRPFLAGPSRRHC